jgi:hypothetical protein
MSIFSILSFALLAASPALENSTTAIVSQYDVCLRDTADESGTILWAPYKGDTITVINNKIGWNHSHIIHGNWYLVRTNDNHQGWLYEHDIYIPSLSEDQLIDKLYHPDIEGKANAIFQLGITKSPKGKQHLINLLGTDKKVGNWCIEALGTYRDTSLLPIFIDILKSSNNSLKRAAISALSNYRNISYAKYITPVLDISDINIKKSAIANLAIFNNDSINQIIDNKKISLVELFSDLHDAYSNDNIAILLKHLDPMNGLYLKLITEGGYYRFDGHLSRKEAVEFFEGKSTRHNIDTDFFSIYNINDITITTIYHYPELIKEVEPYKIKYMFPYKGLFEKKKIIDYNDSITIVVTWNSFKNVTIGYHHGAYLYFIKRSNVWYLVGFEQVYG